MTTTRQRPQHTPSVPCTVWFGPTVSMAEELEFTDLLVSQRGVAVCCWPRDADRVERLTAAKVPRLLLVAPNATPPVPSSLQVSLCTTAGTDEFHAALARLAEHSRVRASEA